MDTAWGEFTGHCDDQSSERLLRFYEAEQRVKRARAARSCASRLSIRRSRHRLSLLELRHGVDAYTVRDALKLAHQLSTDEPGLVDVTLTITPEEDARATSRPPEESTVEDVGAHAPPVVVSRNSITRRSPT